MEANLKLERELFVSNLNGTSTIEILCLTTLTPVSVLLRQYILTITGVNVTNSSWRFRFVVDVICLCLPFLLSCTLLDGYYWQLLCTMMWLLLSHILFRFHRNWRSERFSSLSSKSKINQLIIDSQLRFISYFRIEVNICTAIAILAVDFKIFPRRLAKAETYGIGLMDIGVGFFVIASAIVAPEARQASRCRTDKAKEGETLKHHSRHFPFQLMNALIKAFKSTSPLIIVGFGRLVATSSVNYQLHVSEYGVHWNFFFTLAMIRMLASGMFAFVPVRCSGLLGIVIGVLYQIALTHYELRDVIIMGFDGSGGRDGIIAANREGIFSCIGYLSLYLIGVEIGKYILRPRFSLAQWLKAILYLFLTDMVFWVLTWQNVHFFEPVSRRFANFSYVLWMVSFSLFNLSIYFFVEVFAIFCMTYCNWSLEMPFAGCLGCSPTVKEEEAKLQLTKVSMDDSYTCSCLYAAIARNQLGFFLLVNVMTGLVNLSFNTIIIDGWLAFIILICYIHAVCLIIIIVHKNKVNTKVW